MQTGYIKYLVDRVYMSHNNTSNRKFIRNTARDQLWETNDLSPALET